MRVRVRVFGLRVPTRVYELVKPFDLSLLLYRKSGETYNFHFRGNGEAGRGWDGVWCIGPMLPKPSLPRSVQHRWALRQATSQRPPGIHNGAKSS